MLLEPPVDVVVVKLLGPQHPGKRLAHDIRLVGGQRRRDDRCIERVRFPLAHLHDYVEACRKRSELAVLLRR